MLRLVTAVCYGAALLLTWLTLLGLYAGGGRQFELLLGGWAFCTAGLFAIGRLAHLARRDDE